MQVEELSRQVQTALAEEMPEVEVVLVERPTPGLLRVYIDRPEGVDLAVCERASRRLGFLRDRFALEVSSPGPERPLTSTEHFRRASGSRVAVRTAQPVDGRRKFEGTLLAADGDRLTLDQDGATVVIPRQAVQRARLVLESAGGTR